VKNGHNVAAIENHHNDVFANTYSNARNAYYNIAGYPTAKFDGVLTYVGGNATQSMYSAYLPLVNQRNVVWCDFDLAAYILDFGTYYTVYVDVEMVNPVSIDDLVLYIVLNESKIPYSWQILDTVNFVNRLMVPDENGTSVDFSGENIVYYQFDFSLDTGWVPDNMELVAFLQDYSTTEILQGTKKSLTALGYPPQIVQHPQNMEVPLGDSAGFTVSANGAVPLSYQWQKDGIDLVGEHENTLIINPVSYTDTGEYRCIASNVYGSATSESANLAIDYIELSLKIMLEGPFYYGFMYSNITMLPLNQPYNVPPWNYTGDESVAFIPSIAVVDWVLVELLSIVEWYGVTVYRPLERKAGFLLSDGTITSIDGVSLVKCIKPLDPNFIVRVYHRNHLCITSSGTPSSAGDVYQYDFTTGPEQAFGGEHAQKELSLGVWGMMAGDGNADGQVDNKDKDDVWINEFGMVGYHQADYNMENFVNDNDLADKWLPNTGKGIQIRDSLMLGWACGDTLIDIRDGQKYATVQIGTQCWMAQNINIGLRTNGSEDQTDNYLVEKYCYNDTEINCNQLGGLYQWNEMMQYSPEPGIQGICPPSDGWHIPTDEEWCTLTQYLDPTVDCNATGWTGTDAGDKMKSTSGWASGGNGNNQSGFNAFPSGHRNDEGNFNAISNFAYFWSSSDDAGGSLWIWQLGFNNPGLFRYYHLADFGFSVRCVKD
jgi:uncharacterized protein (TIGR02145 family)